MSNKHRETFDRFGKKCMTSIPFVEAKPGQPVRYRDTFTAEEVAKVLKDSPQGSIRISVAMLPSKHGGTYPLLAIEPSLTKADIAAFSAKKAPKGRKS